MENNIKFRNHVSVILENSLKTIGTILALFFFNLISDLGEEGITAEDILILVGIFVVILGVAVGYQAFIWAKTYITIEENTLIVERNTLNKKRNTIGLKNVSNVNLEQNLLEMLLGTCKVKLDTNSLSTADQTDVNIVLKKADAENFRRIVLARAEGQEVQIIGVGLSVDVQVVAEKGPVEEASQNKPENLNVGINASDTTTLIGNIGDIILHGLFSLRISTIVVFVAVILLQIGLLQEMGMDTLQEIFAEVIGGLFATLWISAVLLWGIVKEFIKYLNFRIERKKDKVFLSYGLFKKVAYSVPVDKINGIRLTQTLIARMSKRYMVEIINVGMDDDENEANTFFLPYSKLDTIQEQLHMLLPEFDGAIEIKEEKQPKAIWLLSIPWLLLYIVITAVAYILVANYAPEPEVMKDGVIFVAAVIFVWRLIAKIARFITKGIKVDEKFLKIVDGGFAKRTLFVKYDKIQYVTGKQCVLAKHFKIQKGTISLLASLKNRIHELPYFKENDMEQLKKHLI